MKKIILSMSWMLACSVWVCGQEKLWSLDDCMRYAVENSPKVKKQIYTADNYKADRNAAVASFFPAAQANVGANLNYGRSINPETNTYNNVSTFSNNYNLQVNIPVFTGGQLINQWLMSKSNRRMGVNDVQKAKDDQALLTMQSFLDVVYYQGTIRMAEEKLEESKRTLYKTRRQYELGLKGKADIAQFEAQVAADDYTLTHQQNLYDVALLKLKENMNLPSDSSLAVDTVLPEILLLPEPENVAELVAFASGNNPTALQAEFQLKQSRYQYRIRKGQLFPTISFSAGISTNYFENLKSAVTPPSFSSQFRNNMGQYLGFSLSFPLFDGLSRVTNVRKARNSVRIAEETRTEVLRQLQTAVEQSVLDREGFAKEAVQMEKKVESDALAYALTRRKYEEGLMSALDLQTSSNTLLTSKADLLQKKLMYLLKSKLVDYYKGKPIY